MFVDRLGHLTDGQQEAVTTRTREGQIMKRIITASMIAIVLSAAVASAQQPRPVFEA
jgi:hypothetical protein